MLDTHGQTEAFASTENLHRNVDFRTPADPEAGWAARNPDRALVFLFVSPRDCGAIDELMAV
ncbi:hypothetical protein [Allosphingosinicella sp.]|jgi:hypothetical protein|uniref:hypothetical protein n=1 Tax=Allosphingosinicella sp. TaxID=2823234 RepID=UPI002EFC3C7A